MSRDLLLIQWKCGIFLDCAPDFMCVGFHVVVNFKLQRICSVWEILQRRILADHDALRARDFLWFIFCVRTFGNPANPFEIWIMPSKLGLPPYFWRLQ